jgi:signal transduction histidine kinase
VTLAVVIAFLVPLGVAVQVLASERATDVARSDSQSVTAILASVDDTTTIGRVVAQVAARGQERVSVFLSNGDVIGDTSSGGSALDLARRGRAFTTNSRGDRSIFVPVRGPSGQTSVVRVVVPRSELRRGVTGTWLALASVGLALVALAIILADRLALSIVRPVHALADTAGRLERGELDARVEPAGPREVATVGNALNLLAGRIRGFLAAEREAVADVSHRLRTPLTVLRLDAEALPAGAQRNRLTEDIGDLEAAVDQVILDAREPAAKGGSSDLVSVTRSRFNFWSALAKSQGRSCDFTAHVDTAEVSVAAAELHAAIDALITNVLTHTAERTGFRVAVTAHSGMSQLAVEDDGPGWPRDFRPRRGRSGRGSTGLGLDIARQVAEGSGGQLRLEQGTNGGARAVLTFNQPPSLFSST